tara:strand:+ start:481 stop:681 length:201 start_codon:yes stop_codon:yes gene_type:complete
MNNVEVKRLAELRNYVISYYNELKEKAPGGTASLTSTREIATVCETVVNSMDDLLKGYVSFGKNDK